MATKTDAPVTAMRGAGLLQAQHDGREAVIDAPRLVIEPWDGLN